jgi:hypothetical protein
LLVGGVNAEWLDSLRHDLSGFSCGDPSVDGWLRTGVESEVAGARARVAVLGRRVLGCYGSAPFRSASSPGSRGARRVGRYHPFWGS